MLPDHFLVVGSDTAWLEATQMILSDPESLAKAHHVTACSDDKVALHAVEAKQNPVSAVVIFGFHADASTSCAQAATGFGARELAINIRSIKRSLPILFVTPVRLDLLNRYMASTDHVGVVANESLPCVLDALAKLRKPRAARKPPTIDAGKNPADEPWAQVDIFIGVEALNVRVILNGDVLANEPLGSSLLRDLENAQDEFRPPWYLYYYESSGNCHLHENYLRRLSYIGERIHQYLLMEPQRTAIATCLKRVGKMDKVHFRFIADHKAFPDVPFEALRDRAKDRFIRSISPVARRILLDQSETLVSDFVRPAPKQSRPVRKSLTGPMLIIKSDSGLGTLQVEDHTFDRQDTQTFHRLPDLDTEVAGIIKARATNARAMTKLCPLRAGSDNIDVLEKAIKSRSWQIVHYCGHSVRADNHEVFLVLPGKLPGELVGLSMEDFAPTLREAGVKLLVLSSCEGASSYGLFRVAQEGIPATIGFRWEVMSEDATRFSKRLHENLAQGMPLGTGYLDAVRVLLKPKSPAFLSTMLVVQQDTWAA